MLITSIIFSKDRPAQLDLCLSSIERNFKDCGRTTVLYNNSKDFVDSYRTVQKEHPDTFFWPQGISLYKDVYAAISTVQDDYVCFFTDDDIFFASLKTIPLKNILDNKDVTCVSLRLGFNICQRQHGDNIYHDRLNEHIVKDNFIWWPRTAYLYGSYWSYSLSVDGHIFRKSDLLDMFDELCYLESKYKWKQTPNELEGALQRFWAIAPNVMVCPQHSVVVNSPNNRVQDTHADNRAGDVHATDNHFLLKKYISGERINLKQLSFNNIRCPHHEIDILKGLQ